MVSLEFFIGNPSGRTMVLELTQSPNNNEYQEYLLEVKAAGA
jgi:hypothetical protein